jgi:hypothetical protein
MKKSSYPASHGAKSSEPSFQHCNSVAVTFASMFAVYAFLVYYYFTDPSVISKYTLYIPLFFGLPIIAYDVLVLKVYQRVGISLKPVNAFDFKRLAVKLYGLVMIFATISGIYWLIPEYDKAMYQRFFALIRLLLPWLLGLGVVYFAWMDRRQAQPEDDYWHAGMFFLGEWEKVNKNVVAALARGWLVKIFFLPMMADFLFNEIGQFANAGVNFDSPFYPVYDQIIRLVLIADLIPACVGYSLTLKVLDSHIRTADDSVRGWIFCLVCYPPFWTGVFYDNYLPYMSGQNWSGWLGDASPLRWVWAGALVVCFVIYASASVVFGTRWSNLTYRGLMCKGPYRLMKHPAYFFKNFGWWLIGIPFIVKSNTTFETWIQACLFSVGVSAVYYMRAVTEERHLSRYPEYREYALWMNDHATFRFLNRLFPFLRYNPAKYGY